MEDIGLMAMLFFRAVQCPDETYGSSVLKLREAKFLVG